MIKKSTPRFRTAAGFDHLDSVPASRKRGAVRCMLERGSGDRLRTCAAVPPPVPGADRASVRCEPRVATARRR